MLNTHGIHYTDNDIRISLRIYNCNDAPPHKSLQTCNKDDSMSNKSKNSKHFLLHNFYESLKNHCMNKKIQKTSFI